MTKDWPGYPLPDGDLGSDEIVCQLVYLPDRDAYWQAFFSSYQFLCNWLAWQRDDDHRGKDAAANWREAFELTMECWRMSCMTDITDRMDIMIDLLGNQLACCDSWTVGPVITVVTNITPGVGDDPTVWGETAVADWEEWNDYVCYHAHQYVDTLINSAKALDVAIELSSYTLEFLTAIVKTLQFLALGQPLGISDMIELYQGFRDAVDLVGEFDGLADRFEAARPDIVCSIIQGGSLSDAVEAAVDNNTIWLLFYLFTDYTAVQALIYEGTVDGTEYLPPIKRYDCDTCDYEQQGEDDLYINWQFVQSHDYDEITKEWTVVALSTGGCFQCGFQFWTDSGKTVKQLVKIVVSECDGTVKCGALNTTKGIADNSMVYEYDHPPLAHIDLAFIDDYRHLHEQPGTQYTIKFKLYL